MFLFLSFGRLLLGLLVHRASLGGSAALQPSPSWISGVALARGCSYLGMCPTSGVTGQLPTGGLLEWLAGSRRAMGSTAHGSRRRRCGGALGSPRARRLAPAPQIRSRSHSSRSSTRKFILHLGWLLPLVAPADDLGVLGPPLDGGSDEPRGARCAGVLRPRRRSERQHSAQRPTQLLRINFFFSSSLLLLSSAIVYLPAPAGRPGAALLVRNSE